MLRFIVLALLFAFAALPARADQPQAREVARINNCQPKKIDVYQNSPGRLGDTVYQVTCTLPKTVDANAPAGPDALLIDCNESLCTVMRALTLSGK